MKGFFLIWGLLIFSTADAATVDTVSIYSASMKQSRNCVVIKPAGYKKKNRSFPTVYLLHGYAGDYSNWIKKVPALKTYADELGILIVCPDGAFSSWYLDSPVDSTMRYETYIGKEVPAFIDTHYRTRKDRKARAIAGLSMGGHGALFLAFRHAAFFGACGSMSGGVDLYRTRNRFDLVKRIGDTLQHAANWASYSVMQVVEAYPKDSLKIIIDCGVDDFFYADNKRLHEKLLIRKVPHDYTERPGKHSWDYWANAVRYQLIFFRSYFDQTLPAK